MIFLDASAIIAILTREPEADEFVDLLQSESERITSPIAIFEAALGIRRKRRSSVAEAERNVHEFLTLAQIEIVPIGAAEAAAALAAFSRYGKGGGHPARLNLGDCFICGGQESPGSVAFQRRRFQQN